MARAADLESVRQLIAEAADRLTSDGDPRVRAGDRLTSDGDPRLRAVERRLRAIDPVLAGTTGGVPVWTRRAAEPVIAFAVSWGVAAAARALGFPTPLMLVTTVIALLVALWLASVAGERLGRPGVRRLPAAPAPRGLIAVHEDLLSVRVRLVSAGLRRVDSRRWRPPYLRWRLADDPVLRRVAHADLLLCQAIDHLEGCLAEEAAA